MGGKLRIISLAVAVLLMVAVCGTASQKMSVEEIQEHLLNLVKDKFNQSSITTRNFKDGSNGHGRKISVEVKKAFNCMKNGNIKMRDWIFDNLIIPNGMSKRKGVEQVTYTGDMCYEALSMCNANHIFGKEERRYTGVVPALDGSDYNSLETGRSMQNFIRLLNPYFEDEECGIVDRGNPREISNIVSSENLLKSHDASILFMQYGQFIDHDITLFTELIEPAECCEHYAEEEDCLNIEVVKDEFYEKFNCGIDCLPFARSASFVSGCTFYDCERRINLVTGFIDLSQVYDVSDDALNNLRDGFLLKTSTDTELDTFSRCRECDVNSRLLAYLPPDNTTYEDDFLVGDVRAEEQPALTSIHTIFVRAHNLFANAIKANQPYLDDKRIFELARLYLIAVYQNIMYEEWLPVLFSRETLLEHGLTFNEPWFFDQDLPTGTFDEFSAVAFRMGHTLIPNIFPFEASACQDREDVLLVDNFDSQFSLLRDEGRHPSDFMEVEACNNAPEFDESFVNTIRNSLFSTDGLCGEDLMARNIQRGRDHGIPNYNAYRKFFGLELVKDYNILSVMRTRAGQNLLRAYKDVTDMDLFVAGLAEEPIGGNKFGPTFTNILALQFGIYKFTHLGWFENVFNGADLEAIRKTTFSDILCEVTCINEIQENAFRVPDCCSNAKRSCRARNKNGNIIELLERGSYYGPNIDWGYNYGY